MTHLTRECGQSLVRKLLLSSASASKMIVAKVDALPGLVIGVLVLNEEGGNPCSWTLGFSLGGCLSTPRAAVSCRMEPIRMKVASMVTFEERLKGFSLPQEVLK